MIGRALKRLLVRLISLLSGARPCPQRALAAIAPAKVLVVVPDERVGELLLAGPLIRAVAARLPAASVHLLHSERIGWIAARLPGVATAVPFTKRDFFRHPRAFLAFLQRLRRERYGLAIDGGKDDQLSLTTAILMRISGAPIRLGWRRGAAPFLTLSVAPGPDDVPEAERRLHLMTTFGDRPREQTLRLSMGRGAVTSVPFGAGVAKPRVGIYAGARKGDHRLGPEILAALARDLVARRFDPVLIPGLDDAAACAEIGASTGARAAPVAAGEQLATLLQTMDLVISANTGPMHLAVAVGVPTLGVFVKVDPARWGHAWGPHRTLDFRNAPPDPAVISSTAADMLGSP